MNDVQNFFRFSSKNDELKSDIEHVLQQFLRTPEGRELIHDAYEANGRVRIEITTDNELPTKAESRTGKINVSQGQLLTLQYLSSNGKPHDVSLNRVLFHELSHLQDHESLHRKTHSHSEAVSEMKTALSQIAVQVVEEALGVKEVEQEEALRIVAKDLIENNGELSSRIKEIANQTVSREPNIIAKTNEFMQKYYGEEHRHDHSSTHNGSPELEVKSMLSNH